MSDAPVFITTDAVGGVWNYSLALAQGLSRPSVLAVLGPPPDSGQRAQAEALAGCTLLHTGLDLDWIVKGRAALDAVIAGLIERARACGAGAAHLHAPALAAGGWPIPTVSVAHSCMATWWQAVRGGDLPDDIAWHARATADGMAASDAVAAPSAAFATMLTRCYGPRRQVEIVHNGLPDPASTPVPRFCHVLTAGRLWDEAKNVAVLDAAARLLPFPVKAAGPCSAPGGDPARFRHLETLGVLTPEDLREAMASAAIFASASRYEPFGLAVLEAAQQATPLVLADIPTFRELWSDAAVFVDPGDAMGWANALRALMASPEDRDRLGGAASARARRYTQQSMVAGTLRLHRTVGARALRAA